MRKQLTAFIYISIAVCLIVQPSPKPSSAQRRQGTRADTTARPAQRRQAPAPNQRQAPEDIPGYWWDKCMVGLLGRDMSRNEALEIAHKLTIDNANWHLYLPPCPLTEKEVISHPLFKSNDFRISCFHPGAAHCYRSNPKARLFSDKFETDSRATNHAQQCCYANAQLIRDTATKIETGAGTPDFVNSDLFDGGDNEGHQKWDVKPWTVLSLREYHRAWTPSRGVNEPFRAIVFAKGSTRANIGLAIGDDLLPEPVINTTQYIWQNTHVRVNEGDVIKFHVLKGKIKIGQTTYSDPDGVKNLTPEESFRLELSKAVASLVSESSPFGALIGTVYVSQYRPGGELDDSSITEPFLIGSDRSITFSGSGYLLLAVNDTVYDDNSGYFIIEMQRVKSSN